MRGKKIDRYYGEFVKVGHPLGGTDLPNTKAETLECLRVYLPKLALTYGAVLSTGPSLASAQPGPPSGEFVDWAIRDVLPSWAAAMVMHRVPNPIERAARQASVWAAIKGIHFAMVPLPEFRQAHGGWPPRGEVRRVLNGPPRRGTSRAVTPSAVGPWLSGWVDLVAAIVAFALIEAR